MCQVNQSKDVVCPTCGTCPTCGRKTWDYNKYYYYPFYSPDPTWPTTSTDPYYQSVWTTTCVGDKENGK